MHHALHHHHHHHQAHHHRHHAPNAVAVGAEVRTAVDQAIGAEKVPATWRDSLLFIAAQESSGHVGARNTTDSARGLFQLTKAAWHHNPNGAASFGNAREETQGAIRYIQARYTTAPNAEAFWRVHHWY
jgi:SLT domain-containing protein